MHTLKYFKILFLFSILFFSFTLSTFASRFNFTLDGSNGSQITGYNEIMGDTTFYPGDHIPIYGYMRAGSATPPATGNTTTVSMKAMIMRDGTNYSSYAEIIPQGTIHFSPDCNNTPPGESCERQGFNNSLIAPPTPGAYTIKFMNTGFLQNFYDESLSFTVANPNPTIVTVTATPSIISPTGSSVIKWSSPMSSVCDIEGGLQNQGYTGSFVVSSLTSDKMYTITCTNYGVVGSGSATVGVMSLNVSANPTSVAQPGDTSSIFWTSQHADSCTPAKRHLQ
jgi:hypothetical protein